MLIPFPIIRVVFVEGESKQKIREQRTEGGVQGST
jgi:hypothetical protein